MRDTTLVSKLEDRVYTEQEINGFLSRYHPDGCALVILISSR